MIRSSRSSPTRRRRLRNSEVRPYLGKNQCRERLILSIAVSCSRLAGYALPRLKRAKASSRSMLSNGVTSSFALSYSLLDTQARPRLLAQRLPDRDNRRNRRDLLRQKPQIPINHGIEHNDWRTSRAITGRKALIPINLSQVPGITWGVVNTGVTHRAPQLPSPRASRGYRRLPCTPTRSASEGYVPTPRAGLIAGVSPRGVTGSAARLNQAHGAAPPADPRSSRQRRSCEEHSCRERL